MADAARKPWPLPTSDIGRKMQAEIDSRRRFEIGPLRGDYVWRATCPWCHELIVIMARADVNRPRLPPPVKGDAVNCDPPCKGLSVVVGVDERNFRCRLKRVQVPGMLEQ